MSKMLLISQSETDTWFVNGISIGQRQPKNVIGDRIREVLKERNETEEQFVEKFETNYRENIKRILKNEEIPKEKVFKKITEFLGKEKEFFFDKELQNVIVNDSRMVVGEYATDKRAMEVKKELDEYITDCYAHSLPIIVRMPKE